MTLIVGFKCGDSAVLCADSQETRGPLKTEINKLPIRHGHDGLDIVFGGAGHGELVDACRLRVCDALAGVSTQGEAAIRAELEAAIVAFHRSDVYRRFPGDTEDKYLAGLIAVRSAAREVFLYHFFNPVVKPIETYELAGEDYAFLARIVQRRYRPSVTVHQAVLIGIEVINEGKGISVTVGGPTRVVIATPDGIREEENQRVLWTEAHISTQNQLIDELRFDLGSTGGQVEDKLKIFSNSITSVRGVYGSKYTAWPRPTLTGATMSQNDEFVDRPWMC